MGHPLKGTWPLPLCVILHRTCQFCLLILLRWFHPLPVVRMSEHTVSGTRSLETSNESLAASSIHAEASHIHLGYVEPFRLQTADFCSRVYNRHELLFYFAPSPPCPTPYNPGALASSCIWNPATCPTIAAVNAPLPASTTCGWAFLTGLPQGSPS